MAKKILIALPPGLLEKIDFIAQEEYRTRSDLVREALRRYADNFTKTFDPIKAATLQIVEEEGIAS